MYLLSKSVCMCVCVFIGITIVRDDAPGSEGGIQASQHPKHAEPAQMFPSLIHLKKLGEVSVHYRDGTANSGGGITRKRGTFNSVHHSLMNHRTICISI